MAQDWAKAFYNTKRWKACRDAYIAERIHFDGGLCEGCQKRLGYIVHHKIKLTRANIKDPNVALNHDNLSYECKICHDEHEGHGLGKKSKPICNFNSDGQPIPKL